MNNKCKVVFQKPPNSWGKIIGYRLFEIGEGADFEPIAILNKDGGIVMLDWLEDYNANNNRRNSVKQK